MAAVEMTAAERLSAHLLDQARRVWGRVGFEDPTDNAEFERLLPDNLAYHCEKRITREDLTTARTLRAKIEERLTGGAPVPRCGDVVVCIATRENYKGEMVRHEGGRADRNFCNEPGLAICTQPMTPFVRVGSKGEPVTDTSGGPWVGATKEELAYVGTRDALFWTWGHCGRCAGGGLTIRAKVNVWELRSEKVY